LTVEDLIKQITEMYDEAAMYEFDSVKDAIAVICSVLKYLERQCESEIVDLRGVNENDKSD